MSKRNRRSRAESPRAESSFVEADELFAERPGHRQARLEQILKQEVDSILRDETSDPALAGVRVISLTLSPDGGHARIGYAVEARPSEESQTKRKTQTALDRATGFLRSRLASQLNLKKLPRLGFTFVGVFEAPAAGVSDEEVDGWSE